MPTYLYDPTEAITGDKFLTPVYFNKQVLIKYMYDGRFHCDFASDTLGTVYGEDFVMAFGLNQRGTVIAWLGDLQKLPEKEQLHWSLENKGSDHDMRSEFFDAQVGGTFSPPTAAVKCLNRLAQLNSAFHLRFGFHLYKPRPLEDRVAETRRYRRLIIGSRDDFKTFVSELNEIINESADLSSLQRLLHEHRVEVADGARGNKLLEATYKSVLGDTENLIAPFYYLYDLRLWADHAISDERRDDVASSLGVSPVDDYEQLMDALLTKIDASVQGLLVRVETV